MTHLELGDVADFVRGVARGDDRVRMEKHLASGCERCRDAVSFLRDVASLSRADERWEPPASVVRHAIAILPPAARFTRRLIGRLVFDSFSQPQPAGVRSVHRRSRQLMYRAGEVYVDLRIEQEQARRRVSLVGQIVSRDGSAITPPDVFLLEAGRAVQAAPVTEFGEFQMEYEPKPRLRLRIPLEDGTV